MAENENFTQYTTEFACAENCGNDKLAEWLYTTCRNRCYTISNLRDCIIKYTVEPLLKDTPELRTPLSKDTSVYVPSEWN